VVRQPGDPAALGGRHELLHHGNIDRIEAGDPEPDEKAADHQIHPTMLWGQRHQPRRDREVQDRGNNDLAPADLVGNPAPDYRAEWRADPGRQQYRCRLAIGQISVLDEEPENKPDQQVIEEIEHIADRRRGEDLPLIDCELLLLLQICEHDVRLRPRLIARRLNRWQVFGRNSPDSAAGRRHCLVF
jgi:hypothetical protein